MRVQSNFLREFPFPCKLVKDVTGERALLHTERSKVQKYDFVISDRTHSIPIPHSLVCSTPRNSRLGTQSARGYKRFKAVAVSKWCFKCWRWIWRQWERSVGSSRFDWPPRRRRSNELMSTFIHFISIFLHITTLIQKAQSLNNCIISCCPTLFGCEID